MTINAGTALVSSFSKMGTEPPFSVSYERVVFERRADLVTCSQYSARETCMCLQDSGSSDSTASPASVSPDTPVKHHFASSRPTTVERMTKPQLNLIATLQVSHMFSMNHQQLLSKYCM